MLTIFNAFFIILSQAYYYFSICDCVDIKSDNFAFFCFVLYKKKKITSDRFGKLNNLFGS